MKIITEHDASFLPTENDRVLFSEFLENAQAAWGRIPEAERSSAYIKGSGEYVYFEIFSEREETPDEEAARLTTHAERLKAEREETERKERALLEKLLKKFGAPAE